MVIDWAIWKNQYVNEHVFQGFSDAVYFIVDIYETKNYSILLFYVISFTIHFGRMQNLNTVEK